MNIAWNEVEFLSFCIRYQSSRSSRGYTGQQGSQEGTIQHRLCVQDESSRPRCTETCLQCLQCLHSSEEAVPITSLLLGERSFRCYEQRQNPWTGYRSCFVASAFLNMERTDSTATHSRYRHALGLAPINRVGTSLHLAFMASIVRPDDGCQKHYTCMFSKINKLQLLERKGFWGHSPCKLRLICPAKLR